VATWYPSSICSLLFLLVGALLGKIAALLLRLRPPHSKMLVLCTTFGNVGALPYVLIPPIVANWSLVANDPEAIGKGFAAISLFALPWGITLFSFGQRYATSLAQRVSPALSKPQRQQQQQQGTSAAPSGTTPTVVVDGGTGPGSGNGTDTFGGVDGLRSPLRRHCRLVCARLRCIEPAVAGSLIGIIVGCIGPLREFIGEAGPLRFIGAFSYSLGSAGISLSTMVLGGSLAMGAKMQLAARRRRMLKHGGQSGGSSKGGEGGVDSERSANVSTASHGPSPMQRLVTGALIVKLIAMPAVTIPLVYLAARSGVLRADEPMLLMVLMIQGGVPSAQTTLALLQAAGLQKEAGEMSLVYLPMYIVSVLTMAVVIVVAVQAIGTLQQLDGVLLTPNASAFD
jgi:predicted permease